MVGKTPQVREIVYNVLDDSGERTVIAKGATTVDVGDTRELFTRTSNLEAFTTNNFSNISVAQSDILQLEYTLGGLGVDTSYSPLLLTLQSDHADNVDRIEVLEEVHLSNSLIVSNNFSNITVLQEIVDSNVGRIDGIVADQLSNAVILSGTFSNVSNIQTELLSNVGRIEDLETDIGAIVNYGDITSLQSSVTDLIDRVTSTIVRVGEDAGTGAPGGTSVSIGNNTGTNIGNNSIAIGAQAQNLTDSVEGNQTLNSIVINATGQLLNSTRRNTLVIAPIQTDDSNTINIMGYNDLTKEVVQSTLLRGIDGNVHATTNISVNNDTILFETNGNGSFGGDIEIAGNLEVGGTSSFTGAMQVDDTLEIADTSSFGGDMTIDANAFVYGQSFVVRNLFADKIKLHNNGTGSFSSHVDVRENLEVGGTSSFTRAMQVDDTLEIADASSFGGDMTIDANAFVYGQSFAMYDGITENIYIRNDGNASFNQKLLARNIDCNETIDGFGTFNMKSDPTTATATISSDGTSSFAGKMQIQDELVVEGHSSFVGGIKVLSAYTSSFGGPIVVNNTSSFTGVANFEDNISTTGESFKMFDGTTENIYIRNDGNASFNQKLLVQNIDCNETIDGFGTFNMKSESDPTTATATINSDGTSSFAGAMQISNTLVMNDTLTIQDDSSLTGNGKVTINPGTDGTETITVQGGIYIRNGSADENINATISKSGTGSFTKLISEQGTFGGTTFTDSVTANFGISSTNTGSFTTLQGGTGSFGGTKFTGSVTANSGITSTNTGSFTTLKGGTGSFGGTKFTGSVTANSGITSTNTGSFTTLQGGTGSFGGTKFTGSVTANSGITSTNTGSFTTLKGGTGSFGGTKFTGSVTANSGITSTNTGSFTTLKGGTGSFGGTKFTDSISGTSGSFSSTLKASDFIIPSDRRFKTEITHIPNALEKVKQISGCTYTINDKPSVGVIAQEVLKILPETVHTGDDGYYAVSYHGLIGLLIEAVKELSEKVK
jgi:hypothetical protein